jgi:hypothetical protein
LEAHSAFLLALIEKQPDLAEISNISAKVD